MFVFLFFYYLSFLLSLGQIAAPAVRVHTNGDVDAVGLLVNERGRLVLLRPLTEQRLRCGERELLDAVVGPAHSVVQEVQIPLDLSHL